MNISIIAAVGRKRELGFGNKLPWHLPDDLKRFKALTRGYAVVMGRKTYQAIGRPLPERTNIIITRNKDFTAPGCVVVGSMEEAIAAAEKTNGDAGGGAAESGEVFVIGGAEIYKLALPLANKMYLTHVDADMDADVYFPEFNEKEWRVGATEPHGADEKHPHSFIFKIYERI